MGCIKGTVYVYKKKKQVQKLSSHSHKLKINKHTTGETYNTNVPQKMSSQHILDIIFLSTSNKIHFYMMT